MVIKYIYYFSLTNFYTLLSINNFVVTLQLIFTIMIQRIQTVFLFLVSVAMGVGLLTSLWAKTSSNEIVTLTAFSMKHIQGERVLHETNTVYLGILAVISAGIALFSIFQYRNRFRQMLLGMINSILMAIILGFSLYLSFNGSEYFDASNRGHYTTGFYAIAAGLLCNALANRFIRRDEQLVRSADRMR